MSEQRRGSTGWIYAVLGVLALSAALYLVFSGGGDETVRSGVISTPHTQAQAVATPVPTPQEPAAPTATPTESATAEPARRDEESKPELKPQALRLTATLLPSGGADRKSLRAQVGITEVSAEDLAEYNSWVEAGREGAGPESALDLANVVRWINAPVEIEEDGSAILGPVEVPEAPAYRILAWESDLRYYMGTVALPDAKPEDALIDAGELKAHLPTGLRVQLINNPNPMPHYLANFSRVTGANAEEASRIAPLMEAASKDLYDALQNNLMYLMTADEDAELIPLFPDDALRIRLSTLEGLEAQPIEIELDAESVRTVQLDLSKLFSEEDMNVYDLHGRLVLEAGDQPLPDVPVRWIDAPIASVQTTDANGDFLFQDLPMDRVARFQATISQPEGKRPLTQTEFRFDYNPSLRRDDLEDRDASAEYTVPVYRWLVLDIPDDLKGTLESQSADRYPIYLLERYIEPIETWRAVGADEFLAEPNSMAVSIITPGTYRISTAVSPVEVFPSDAADISKDDLEKHVELSLNAAQPPRMIRVELNPPAAGRPAFVSGSFGSLPPITKQTDADGAFYLDSVNVPEISVEITPPNGKAIERQVSIEEIPDDGIVTIDWE
ncbi:hypothetical protein KQI84_10325 [bacterium]|nr:hypothetical protein [bacterium]